MASEIAVAVIEKLGRLALDQASLVVNFTDDFQWLKEELTRIADDLNDADSHSVQNKRVERWIQQVRDVAWDAEDIIEECAVESLYGNNSQSSCLCSYRRIILQPKFRYIMGRRIKKVRQRMMSIIQDASRAEIVHKMIKLHDQPSTSGSGTLQEVQKPLSRLDSKSSHVAREDKVNDILHLLQTHELPVIAVVGMGGVGKTFLLQHVYNSAKQRFAKSIWLSISQKYSIARLQADVASHIKEWQPENMHLQDIVNGRLSVERAAELIYRCLGNAEALIVLDDVWRVDGGHDLIRNLGLPTGQNSKCKIVVTTRSKEVAKMMSASYIYEMKVLSDEESWRLFCSYAFPDCPENRPPEYLEAAAHAVERECGNLPLAIKTVGASMAHKTLQRDWESKSSQLKKVSTLLDSADPIMSILRLSYDSLPAHLKPCFLYLAFFGEDEKIDPDFLVSCWMAEGFIPEGEGQWNLAFNYLYQLSTLCLVEVEEDEGLFKTCKVHDLLLDLAISICNENKCAVVVEEAGTNNPSADGSSSGCRRILLAKKGIDNNAIANLHFPRFLRTLSLSLNSIENIPSNLLSSVRALRVIDLSRNQISALPKGFGNLKLLKVLNLSRTKVKEVPECVRNLKSLCFLDLPLVIERLPAWIGELQCLQYLGAEGLIKPPKEISNLVSLRLLESNYLMLSVEEDEFLKLKDVVKLTKLQQLKMDLKKEVELKSIEEGVLVPLVNMRSLCIANSILQLNGADNLPCFSEKMKAMEQLEHLCLGNFLLPSWMREFASVRVLDLYECEFSDNPALEAMPNLMTLSLSSTKKKEILKAFGKSGGFPKLRFLRFNMCNDLEELPELKDGAMAGLEKLRLYSCKALQKVPDGLQHLNNLKLLRLNNSGTNELQERLKEDGEDWKKLKANNPSLFIFVRSVISEM